MANKRPKPEEIGSKLRQVAVCIGKDWIASRNACGGFHFDQSKGDNNNEAPGICVIFGNSENGIADTCRGTVKTDELSGFDGIRDRRNGCDKNAYARGEHGPATPQGVKDAVPPFKNALRRS